MTIAEVDPRTEVRELRAEVDALRAQLEGNMPKATAWLQFKVWRQRVALDRLNKRVVAQRFYLRLVNDLGHVPTFEEHNEAIKNAERWEQAAIEAEAPIR